MNQKVIQTLDAQAAQRIVNGAAQVVRAGIVVLDLTGTGGRVVVGDAGFGNDIQPLGQCRAGAQRLAKQCFACSVAVNVGMVEPVQTLL